MKLEQAITERADLKINNVWAASLIEQAKEEVESLWHGGADPNACRRICEILKTALDGLVEVE
jgi:hypothetical protein